MDITDNEPEQVHGAGVEVGAFIRAAFQERFLALPTGDILDVAESVWNNFAPGRPQSLIGELAGEAPPPLYLELMKELHRVRSERFGHARYFIFALDYEYEGADIVFDCDLMWPDGAAIHSFCMQMKREMLGPPGRN